MTNDDEGPTEQNGMSPVVVKVGQGGAYTLKRFHGRLLGKQHVRQAGQNTVILYRVYQTQRGALALHVVESPDWSDWANWGDWRNWGSRKRDRAQRGRERAEERRRERGRGRDRADQWSLNVGGFSFSSSPGRPPVPPRPEPPIPPDVPDAPLAPEPPTPPEENEYSGAWWQTSSRLEVYNTLDELRPHIPAELAMVVAHRLAHGGNLIEDLDI